MIRVTVELVSAIDPARSRVLGIAEIWNLRNRTVETKGRRGDYAFTLSRRGRRGPGGVWKSGDIANFPRMVLGHWDLLFRALREAVGERNA